MSDYRFFINEHDGNGTPTIYRSSLYRAGHDDTWSFYWDGYQMCAVYDDDGYSSPTRDSNPEWTKRVEHAIKMHHEYGLSGDRSEDVSAMLTRLAARLFGHTSFAARFIPVNLDRGVTLYALSWDGDPEGTWRDEIEAVYHGDVWRMRVEEYMGDGHWREADDYADEWYGEHMAEAAHMDDYPLDEFPAHLVLDEAVGA